MEAFKSIYASIGATGVGAVDGVLRFVQSPDLRGAVLAVVSLGCAGYVGFIHCRERRLRGEIALAAEKADAERVANLLDAAAGRLVDPLAKRLEEVFKANAAVRPSAADELGEVVDEVAELLRSRRERHDAREPVTPEMAAHVEAARSAS